MAHSEFRVPTQITDDNDFVKRHFYFPFQIEIEIEIEIILCEEGHASLPSLTSLTTALTLGLRSQASC